MIIPRPLKRVLGKIIPFSQEDKVPTFNLGSGTADSTTYLRGDSTWATVGGGGDYVPYVGATADVNLGTNSLSTEKVFLYDGPNDNYGSIHYTDGNFHIEDADGHPLIVVEDGFIQIHKDATIQSNLFTTYLTAIRDHYLPNASGTIALTSDIPTTLNQLTDVEQPPLPNGYLIWNDDAAIWQTNQLDFKTINSESIVGSGNIAVQATLVSATNIKTINGSSILGSGDLVVGGGGGITVGTTTVTSGTIGRVFFQGTGNVVQQSASLFWDNTNSRLGVGATPATTVRLDVRAQGALSTDIGLRVRNSADTLNIVNVNGRGDTYLGLGAGRLSTGAGNVCIGINSGYSVTSGQENTAIGNSAGFTNAGSQNTYLGASAGQNGTAAQASIFIGYQAGQNSNASNGIFIGQTAAVNGGSGTVAIGNTAGAGTGSHNISLGQSSGTGMTTGSFNTQIGYRSVGSGVTTGNYNNLLGSDIVVGAVSNTAVLADNQGNIAIRKDASHFVGVGYTGVETLGAKLDVKAQGALVSNLAFRVRNSANSANLFVVKGNGVLNAAGLPTSPAGLVTGDIWNNLGILSIV